MGRSASWSWSWSWSGSRGVEDGDGEGEGEGEEGILAGLAVSGLFGGASYRKADRSDGCSVAR